MASLRKYFHILGMAMRNLAQDKMGTATIAVPLTLIIAIAGSVTFYIDGVERDALLAAGAFPDILLQQQVGGRTESLYFDRYQEVLDEIDAVSVAVPRVWGFINYTEPKGAAKAFVVMGMEPGFIESGRFLDAAITRGRHLKEGDLDKTIVGGALAAALNCDAGDIIEITSPDLRRKIAVEVVGLFDSEVQIYTADLALVPIRTAQRILGFYGEGESSDVLIYLKDPAQAESVAATISSRIEGARPLTRKVMQSLTEQSFGQRSGYFQLLWSILLVNVLIISWAVMSRLSLEQRREIGILKAIGWDTQDIMLLKSTETLLIGIFSVTCGLLAGVCYMLLDAPGLKRFIIGWADIYPDFPIPLYIEWQTVFLIAALGILPLLAATLVPVWRLGLTDPVEVIS